jgi:hypothetical protein
VQPWLATHSNQTLPPRRQASMLMMPSVISTIFYGAT